MVLGEPVAPLVECLYKQRLHGAPGNYRARAGKPICRRTLEVSSIISPALRGVQASVKKTPPLAVLCRTIVQFRQKFSAFKFHQLCLLPCAILVAALPR